MSRKICYSTVAVLIIAFFSITVGLGINEAAYADTIEKSVYLGGIPIGIYGRSEYFVVTELVSVMTNEGSFSPALQAGILKGDLILSINDELVCDISTFNNMVRTSDLLSIKIKRGDKIFSTEIEPVYDIVQNEKKIGLMIKNDISGIGTLTFTTREGRLAALGHLICDEFGNGSIYSDGDIFDCDIVGFNPPKQNIPGELRGNIDFTAQIGNYSENSVCGIFGSVKDMSSFNFPLIEVADRDEVAVGKAKIVSTIDGDVPKMYDIEIIKAIKQDKIEDKGLVIRVTDRYLKRTTGGILQGMSGSPIIQNGKLVGAVTHVFMNDPTKGYGIYAEWMLESIGD